MVGPRGWLLSNVTFPGRQVKSDIGERAREISLTRPKAAARQVGYDKVSARSPPFSPLLAGYLRRLDS